MESRDSQSDMQKDPQAESPPPVTPARGSWGEAVFRYHRLWSAGDSGPLSLGLPNAELGVRPAPEGIFFVSRAQVHHTAMHVELLLRWAEAGLIVALAILGALVVVKHETIAQVWLIATWAPAHKSGWALSVGVTALVAGLGLAAWKAAQPFTYGIAEVVFGTVSSAWTAVELLDGSPLSRWATFLGALYVISRGATNIRTAFKEEKEKQLVASRTKVEVEPRYDPPISIRPGR
jgi:hypothetical protein